jgi:hypothetical protein
MLVLSFSIPALKFRLIGPKMTPKSKILIVLPADQLLIS